MKRCHLAIGIVLFQFQLLCNGQSRIPFSKGESTQYNAAERNPYISRGLSNRGNSSAQRNCNSIEWPQDNFIAGPFPVNASYTRLCPRIVGIFGIHTTCNLYSICGNGCFTVNRCPPFQNFIPERRTCVPAENYICSKAETTENWRNVIAKFGTTTSSDKDRISFPENSPIREGNVKSDRSFNEFSQENQRGKIENGNEFDQRNRLGNNENTNNYDLENRWGQNEIVNNFGQENRRSQNGNVNNFGQENRWGQNGNVNNFGQQNQRGNNGNVNNFGQENRWGQNGNVKNFGQENQRGQNGNVQNFGQENRGGQNGNVNNFGQENQRGNNGNVNNFGQENQRGNNGNVNNFGQENQRGNNGNLNNFGHENQRGQNGNVNNFGQENRNGNNRNANTFGQENRRGHNGKVVLLEAPVLNGGNDGKSGNQNFNPQRGNVGVSGKYVNSAALTTKSLINCREEQVGNFAHPESCNLYIECANGNQLTRRCAPGTVFNPDLTLCDFARNVPECNAERETWKLRPSINNNNKRAEGLELTALYGNPRNHQSLKRSVPTEKSSRLCTASENYVEPDPEYCNKFQVCSNGRIFTENCGPGTLFDPLNSVCNFPDRVDCESRKADLGTYGCQKQHTYRTSHWEFCNKFVECDKGVLAIKTCPPALVFDVESGNCDYAHRIECRKPISLEHDTDINSGLPVAIRSVRSVSDYICDETNYIAPHPRCNKFVECEEKRLFVKSCGPGTVYNKYIGQCDWAYNTREADETDCSAYKECKGGEWKGRSCQGGLRFNSLTRKCERGENVECRQNKEPPPAESK